MIETLLTSTLGLFLIIYFLFLNRIKVSLLRFKRHNPFDLDMTTILAVLITISFNLSFPILLGFNYHKMVELYSVIFGDFRMVIFFLNTISVTLILHYIPYAVYIDGKDNKKSKRMVIYSSIILILSCLTTFIILQSN